jgi:hypothetical protein
VGSTGSIWLKWLGAVRLLGRRAGYTQSGENKEAPQRAVFHFADQRSADGTHLTLKNDAIFVNK